MTSGENVLSVVLDQEEGTEHALEVYIRCHSVPLLDDFYTNVTIPRPLSDLNISGDTQGQRESGEYNLLYLSVTHDNILQLLKKGGAAYMIFFSRH